MKTDLRLDFRKGDWFAIALAAILAVLSAAAFVFPAPSARNAQLQILQDGRLIRELPLQSHLDLQISGPYVNQIAVRDGRAAIIASNCPNQACVHSGWIARPGRAIVCLPNHVELRVCGEASDLDLSLG